MYIFFLTVCTDGDFRLAGGSNNNEGRVEYCNGSIWRSVRIIDGNIDDTDATIICKQLGLSDLGKLNYYTIYTISYIQLYTCIQHAGIPEVFRASSPSYHRYILFEDVFSCIGNESNFTDCYRPVVIGELRPDYTNYMYRASGDIAVKCISLLRMLSYMYCCTASFSFY